MVRRFSIFVCITLFFFTSCTEETPPEQTSDQYQKVVSSFYLSLAAIESDQAVFAAEKMNEVAKIYPKEPAAWANLGVFSMRRGNFEMAAEQLSKAENLVPENAQIQFLLGILESRRGNIQPAIDHLQKAAELNPNNARITYALISELERQDVQDNSESIHSLLNTLLERQPDNLAVMLEMTRLASKLNDSALLERSLENLTAESDAWPTEVRNEFEDLKKEILNRPIEDLTFEIAYLRNNLNKLPKFEADFDRIELPPNQVGFLLTDFMWLPEPSTLNEAPDDSITFEQQPLEIAAEGLELSFHVTLAEDSIPDLLVLTRSKAILQNGQTFELPSNESETVSRATVGTFDYNYDFLNDLVFTGSEGIRIFEQNEERTFTEITSDIDLSSSVLNDSYSGVWKSDFDLDGDLDLVLGRNEASPRVLRNNGDGTFTASEQFAGVQNPIDFSWADIDADGDADAVFLTQNGELKIFQNERMSEFSLLENMPQLAPIYSIQVADLDSDSRLDIVALRDSTVEQLTIAEDQMETNVAARMDTPISGETHKELFVQDFDNNGGLDLIISTDTESQLWLSDQQLNLNHHNSSLPGKLYSTTDMTGNNRMDLIGLGDSSAFQLVNSGKKGYNGRMISPRASGSVGDQRINSFGIGGEIEIRSGLLYHKQPITSPVVHFGLGRFDEAEMLRIIWPNGSVQAEFAELGYGSKIFNEQLLKGSCPWIFTHNGEEMEFVSDFLWRTALGLRINAQGEGSVVHSIDWVKIEEDQLKPSNGYYDVRITAELWETHFFDHVSLMAVDHPADTEVMVDERFVLPAPEQQLYPMRSLHPIEQAIDQDRNNVTELVQKEDGKYVDTFELTPYQGVAKDHYLEVDIGDQAVGNKEEPVYLVANGWIYPTDSSINVAISQGDRDPIYGIYLQVPDGKGGWETVRDDIGFPAGKNKSILINLSELPLDHIPQRVRLATNMEIYWNQISWSVGKPGAEIQKHKLQPEIAELRYRGFSKLNQTERFAPEIPDYQHIASTTPQWIDLIGYYTRFGDVKELVEKIDDRYVIMNAGDELLFKFKALPEPPEGWTRDFVLIGDGWVKDGDYNTGHSKTVIPLPYHGMEDYAEHPGSLENDPVYKKHKQDWAQYHTRYITPKLLRSALRLNNESN